MSNFFTKEGLNIIELKKVLLGDNEILRKLALSGIDNENINKKVSEKLKDDSVGVTEFETFLIANNYFVDKKKKQAEFKKMATLWDSALSRNGIKLYQTKEVNGKLAIVHKIGFSKNHFMRFFRLTNDEFDIEQNNDPGFFEKYSRMRLLAMFKKFSDTMPTYSNFKVEMSEYYYDDSFKTYNRDIMIIINESLDTLISSKSISVSTMNEIKKFFKDLQEMKNKFE